MVKRIVIISLSFFLVTSCLMAHATSLWGLHVDGLYSFPKGFKSQLSGAFGLDYNLYLNDKDQSTFFFNADVDFQFRRKCDYLIMGQINNKRTNWVITSNYLQIPVRIGTDLPGGFSLAIGPYFSFGLWGKSKFGTDDSVLEHFYTGNIFTNGCYKRVDVGISLKAGFHLTKNFTFYANYNQSFVSPEKEQWAAISSKERNFSFGLGYVF